MLKICSVCSLNKTRREKGTFQWVIFSESHLLLTHTKMPPLESPSCEKSQSTSSSALNEILYFSSSRAVEDSALNSQKKPTKAIKPHTNPISAMLMTKEAGRGGEVQISPEERHCLAGDVLPLAAVYSHPCFLGSSS